MAEAPPEESTGFTAIQADPEFVELRRSLRSFAFPMAVAFLVWFLLYVLCSAFARGFMAHKVAGNINVGLIFGLLQFVSTFGIAFAYSRYADKHLDPKAEALRNKIDGTNR